MTREAGAAVEAAPAKGQLKAARRGWLGNPRFRVPYTNTIVAADADADAASIIPSNLRSSANRLSRSTLIRKNQKGLKNNVPNWTV